jgi:hypothetical protein
MVSVPQNVWFSGRKLGRRRSRSMVRLKIVQLTTMVSQMRQIGRKTLGDEGYLFGIDLNSIRSEWLRLEFFSSSQRQPPHVPEANNLSDNLFELCSDAR